MIQKMQPPWHNKEMSYKNLESRGRSNIETVNVWNQQFFNIGHKVMMYNNS